MKTQLKLLLFSLIFFVVIVLLNFISKNNLSFLSRASYQKANLHINAKDFMGPLQRNWQAVAQGGEESGVQMLENVSIPATDLQLRYIRLDHIYDFYNVVKRDETTKKLTFNFDELDKTVCDIYKTGAKPFFSLGYMPKDMATDDTLISVPRSWFEWQDLVQKTVEHYSGTQTVLCGSIEGEFLNDIYYEVWNEPDLESFGKWSIYGGKKDYRTLYYYSAQGAKSAQNVHRFLIGGPATTRPYRNWFLGLINYTKAQNLPLDFISWHHYSTKNQDFATELQNVHSWLSSPELKHYHSLPKIISEWGFDSNVNQIADTNVGAAHTVATIRELIDQKVEMAFAFELKDGLNPSWGIFTYEAEPKPRFFALKLLNNLDRYRLRVQGEGSFVKAIASTPLNNSLSLVIVNYDDANKNIESVPIRVTNLKNGTYRLIYTFLNGSNYNQDILVDKNTLSTSVILNPNNVVSLKIILL